VNAQMPFGDLAGRELLLMAAIALVLATVSRLTKLQRTRSTEASRNAAERASSRAYLDRLLGPAQSRVSADEPPGAGDSPRAGMMRVR
jgi:hypothetical protein